MFQPKVTEINPHFNRQFSILWLVNFNLSTDFFFKNKKIAKIIFKIFFRFLFRKLTEFRPNFFSNIKKLPKLFLKVFSNFVFRKNFFYKFFFGKKFFFSQKYFFRIWCLRNNIILRNFLFGFLLIANFLLCNFGVPNKKLWIFFASFFLAMNMNTKF